MRVALFTPSYLDGNDLLGSSRFDRNVRYVRFYKSIQPNIGFTNIHMADNGSSQDNFETFRALCPSVNVRRFDHIERQPIDNGYGYCWRAVWYIRELIESGYDKIIFMDSDAFVLSSRMADYIKNLNLGWESFWVPKYNFPSAECHVLSKDAFPAFMSYTSGNWGDKVGVLMENDLPFTKVNKDFNTNRFGEDAIPQDDTMDGYFQARNAIPLVFK